MDEYVTKSFRGAAANATGIARALHAETLEAEHLLAAILKDQANNASKLIRAIGTELPTFRDACDRFAGRFPSPSTPEKQPASDGFKSLILSAIEVARQLRMNYVGTDHLLLAGIQNTAGPMAEITRESGIDHATISSVAFDKELNLLANVKGEQ
jgi:ATP-dependent Clp protease ATP-binding subunit ClpC